MFNLPYPGQAGSNQIFTLFASACPENSKSEARNPKQILNPNVPITKTMAVFDILHVMIIFGSFEFW